MNWSMSMPCKRACLSVSLFLLVFLATAAQSHAEAPLKPSRPLLYRLCLDFEGGIPANFRILPNGFDLVRPCDSGAPECCPNRFLVFSAQGKDGVVSVRPHLMNLASRKAKSNFLTGHRPIPTPHVATLQLPEGSGRLQISTTDPAVAGGKADVHLKLEVNNQTVLQDQFATAGPVDLLGVGSFLLEGDREPVIYIALSAYRSFQLKFYSCHPSSYVAAAQEIKSITAAIAEAMESGTASGNKTMRECEAAAEVIARLDRKGKG